MAGIDLVHVPYKGGAPAMTDLITGRVALLLGTYSFWEPNEKAGKLKIIAAVTDKRLAVRPDLPTVSESGVPGYFINTWFAMAAPAGTPAAVLDRIHADVVKILRDPGFSEKFMKPQALEPGGNSREEFAALLKKDYAHWGQMVKETGAKIE
jgi:tripartite-type tricarboxylate transporter receptor subunit TctC